MQIEVSPDVIPVLLLALCGCEMSPSSPVFSIHVEHGSDTTGISQLAWKLSSLISAPPRVSFLCPSGKERHPLEALIYLSIQLTPIKWV